MASACTEEESVCNTGSPGGLRACGEPAAREGQAGPVGVAERPAVATKPGNAGGAKGPWFKDNA